MWCRVFYFNDKNMYSLRVETFARGDARARQRAVGDPSEDDARNRRPRPSSQSVSAANLRQTQSQIIIIIEYEDDI